MTCSRDPVNIRDSAWPTIRAWIDEALNDAMVLAANPASAIEVLGALRISTKSVLGAVAFMTGGIFIDHRWLRILGSGHELMLRSIASWNNLTADARAHRLRGALLVADDVVGGFFALNGGGLRGKLGNMHYLAPETLEWEDMEMEYSEFVRWALLGDLGRFYTSCRWEGWCGETEATDGARALSIYPPLWAKGPAAAERSRRAIPIAELWGVSQWFKTRLAPD